MPTNLLLPPYGMFDATLQEFAPIGNAAPSDFLVGDTLTNRDSAKVHFLNQVVADVGKNYWPEWNYASRSWDGLSTSSANAFTEMDLALLMRFQPIFDKKVIVDDIELALLHRNYYLQEDGRDGKMYANIALYFSILPPVFQAGLGALFEGGIMSKVGNLDIQLKARFQRPRPYQAALWFPRSNAQFQLTARGHTPSLISGHCIAGVFGAIAAHLFLESNNGVSYTPKLRAGLTQYAADFGDRRVMAGVHYPSDSLITWLVSLKLLPFVVEPSQLTSATALLKDIAKTSHLWKFVSSPPSQTQSIPSYAALVAEVEAAIT